MPVQPPSSCVVVVICPGGTPVAECESRLRELERRGFAVGRVPAGESADRARCRAAADALERGFDEVMFVGGDVVFDPDDIDRLRAHGLPVCGALVASTAGRRFDADWLPGVETVPLGRGGGLHQVLYLGMGFTLVRREAFEAVAARLRLPVCDARSGAALRPWFLPMVVPDGLDPPTESRWLGGDFAFCERARQCEIRTVADTRVRVWRVGAFPYSWEEAVAEPRKGPDAGVGPPPPVSRTMPPTMPPTRPPTMVPRPLPSPVPQAPASPLAVPVPHPLRGPTRPLRAGFPRMRAYVMTHAGNRDSLDQTLADFRLSDWGEEPEVFEQPADLPVGRDAASANYKRILEDALADGCDFALILEDDVRVARRLREALGRIPLVARDQCDYLSLFVPDLLGSPWERSETALGYRLMRPMYAGPDRLWQKSRAWGSQAYLLSRRLVRAAFGRWDRLSSGQDSRVVSVCSELKVPLWYSDPCLVEHAPLRSAFGTPAAFAPDFRADFEPVSRSGFEPPEAIPGWLSLPEGRLLWQHARGLRVLELGTASGRSTVCLAQSAREVLSVDIREQSEAAEWLRRYGLAERVTLVCGDVAGLDLSGSGPFGFAFIDTGHDGASVTRDIAAALRVLEPGGLLGFHDYPDPGWPDVRRVVDEHAARLGWRRVAQADYLGVFRTA